MRVSPALRLQATRAWRKEHLDETHRGHTISQRIRQLRRIPPELIPLGIVLGVALGAAVYSMINKLLTDKTLRLKRQGPRH